MDQNKSEAPAKKNSFWLDFGPLLIFFGAFHYLKRDYPDAVSYTHLTLPTIYSV